MKTATILAASAFLSGVDFALSSNSRGSAGGITRKLSHKSKKGASQGETLPYDPETFFVGFWEGIDPLDGANIQRTIIPSLDPDVGGYEFTGRIEYSQICGADVDEIPEGEPPTTSNIVPGLLNAIAELTDDGLLTIAADLTCFGDEEPRITGGPATYKPLSPNLMLEIPFFRADFPIVLHRMSMEFEEYFD
mmetsp:Transcript_28499/g.41976  ORF Transcript_28499/g.41976 Transcript_28499/m.41976 type:complete len:192 (-) Transcript_28499:178-753(-)|eukprot:CAMPEP_0194034816 /NCGR_PEP_ID=MMETSP0009_2-20130614/7256_1 /TAXON_ID=210454 /ORGANISM="Grammatophora oceanica, Strain CCMP 410" /LENGTH=191 /DNA_ID=CAMNT_0038675901 /DNA_START=59 /DNA_END=634 /DNA_ORIENTATION=+